MDEENRSLREGLERIGSSIENGLFYFAVALVLFGMVQCDKEINVARIEAGIEAGVEQQESE